MNSNLQLSSLAVLLLASTAALAQAPASSSMQQPRQQQGASGTPADSALSTGSSTPSYADQSFIEATLQGNALQVQASQIAQHKASSGDVKEFSQRMIQTQNQFTAQLTPLAKHLQVKTDQKLSKKQHQELAQLDHLSGSAFDAAYVQVMAKEQHHTLKEFKSHESSENPNIQKIAQLDGPVLAQNYEALQKIAQNQNISLNDKD